MKYLKFIIAALIMIVAAICFYQIIIRLAV